MSEPVQQSFVTWFFKSRAKTVAANFGWQLVTKAVTTLLALAAAGFVARSLGPDGLGLYRNGQAVAGLLAALGMVVSNQVLIHRILSKPEQEGAIFGSALWLSGVGGLLALAAACVIPWQIAGHDARLVVVAACAYFPIMFMVPVAGWFESRMAGRVLAMSQMAGMTLTRTWEIGCSLLGFGVAAFALSYPAGLVLMSSLVAWQYWRWNGPWKTLQWNTGHGRDLALSSAPWMGANFIAQFQGRCELFFLTGLAGVAAGGLFSAANEVLQPFMIIPGFLLSSLFPSIVRSYASDHALGQARMEQYLRLSAGLGLVLAGGICLGAPLAARWIYGSGFETVTPTLRLLAWILVPVYLAAPCNAWMVKENLGWLAALFTAGGLVFNITLDLLLIPRFGVQGAAVAAPLGALLTTILLPSLHPRTRYLAMTQVRALLYPVPNLKAIMNRTADV